MALLCAATVGCKTPSNSSTKDIGFVNTAKASAKVLYSDGRQVFLKSCKPPLPAPLTRDCPSDESAKSMALDDSKGTNPVKDHKQACWDSEHMVQLDGSNRQPLWRDHLSKLNLVEKHSGLKFDFLADAHEMMAAEVDQLISEEDRVVSIRVFTCTCNLRPQTNLHHEECTEVRHTSSEVLTLFVECQYELHGSPFLILAGAEGVLLPQSKFLVFLSIFARPKYQL